MEIAGWDERYRARRKEDVAGEPTTLLRETVVTLKPGRALDLACGTGRNALWLGEQGWRVTAVDGSAAAITILRERAQAKVLTIDARVADLQAEGHSIKAAAFDLVTILFYLQRELFGAAKEAVTPGGTLICIAHTVEGSEKPNATRLASGAELRGYFAGWEIAHYYEGESRDPAHKRAVAEIVAVKPQA